MIKLCKDCKHFKEVSWGAPIPDANDYYKCYHPDYYKTNVVIGKITYYNCNFMRGTMGLCGFAARLFEAK